jgi:hypothetical protein
MPADLRSERLLLLALDEAAEELDLPLTPREVAALARVAARLLADVAAQGRPAMPLFRPPGSPTRPPEGRTGGR